jgi:hypothetical protein
MLVRDWVSMYPLDINANEIVVLGEPDQYMMKALEYQNLSLVPDRTDVVYTGPREGYRDEIRPGLGAAQDAAVGSRWYDLKPPELRQACKPWGGRETGNCTVLPRDVSDLRYGSGPPWVLHAQDFPRVAAVWEDLSIRLKMSSQSSFESEQTAFGFASAYVGLDSVLYHHYTLSNPGQGVERFEAWKWIAHVDLYDPCKAQKLPPPGSVLIPTFLHMCGTYELVDQGTTFRMHKDHLPKDILECDAPLLKHPSKDALRVKFKAARTDWMDEDLRSAWQVCAFVNAMNDALDAWKRKNCFAPNLERTFVPPPYASGWTFAKRAQTSSWFLNKYFRRGGYGDPDKNVVLDGTKIG